MAQPAASESSLSPSHADQETPRAPRDPEILQNTPGEPRDRDDGDLQDGPSVEIDPRQLMELEKALYPGASTWAEDEERLFEILYERERIALLPSHWGIDFRGFPISETTFATSTESPPVIYAHSSKEFQATTALTRLIDLTSNARTASQSGFRRKVPRLIKDGLDHYLSWAAQDGGFDDLRTVPNIITEIIDLEMHDEDITEFMQLRVKALARLQREFLRVDRDLDVWTQVECELMDSSATFEALALEREMKIKEEKLAAVEAKSGLLSDELAAEPGLEPVKDDADAAKTPAIDTYDWLRGHDLKEMDDLKPGLDGVGFDKLPLEKPKNELAGVDVPQPSTEPAPEKPCPVYEPQAPGTTGKEDQPLASPKQEDGEALKAESPEQHPGPPPEHEYRRRPPVVYGLFILNTSVFLLTADAAKGDGGYVSFHVEMDFVDRQQSVWNALTVAIAACRARDELMARAQDFDGLPAEPESDPDA